MGQVMMFKGILEAKQRDIIGGKSTEEIYGIMYFHRICQNIRLSSPKLVEFFVCHEMQIFCMGGTVALRYVNANFPVLQTFSYSKLRTYRIDQVETREQSSCVYLYKVNQNYSIDFRAHIPGVL